MIITDPIFRQAVEAIDKGDVESLARILHANPVLLNERLKSGTEGYFKDPYLLWFVAGNPQRYEKLPINIVDVTRLIIEAAQNNKVETLYHQVSYTLALVSSARVSRESGVQQKLIDCLIDKGADPNRAVEAAVVHCETDALQRLLDRGATLTLPAAIALKRTEDIKVLLSRTTRLERQIALAVASLYGHAWTIALLVASGVDVNTYNPDQFHSHSMPLHQAIISGSLDAVKILVEAGADLKARDKVHKGIPLGWAIYGRTENEIASYLREMMAWQMSEKLLGAGLIDKINQKKIASVLAKEIEV
jgi:peptide-methionine (S)-S-oxide reductase